MRFVINDQIQVSEFRPSDKGALVEHLNDRNIYERTLRIPFPYTEADADEWMALYAKSVQEHGRQLHWAIRNADDFLIGGCGFNGFQADKSHQCEIGYWLATGHWGRGIMTAVVRRMCELPSMISANRSSLPMSPVIIRHRLGSWKSAVLSKRDFFGDIFSRPGNSWMCGCSAC